MNQIDPTMLELIRACGVEPKPFLSVREAAKVLGLSYSKTAAACRAGQIPSRQFGKRIVIPLVLFLELTNGKSEQKWLLVVLLDAAALWARG